MIFNYYPDTDSLYIDLLDKPGVEALEVRPGVVLDFDEAGTLVGIDIDHASVNVDLKSIQVRSLPTREVALVA